MARDMGSSKVTIAYHLSCDQPASKLAGHRDTPKGRWRGEGWGEVREYFAYLQCKSCWWPISWIGLARVPLYTLGFHWRLERGRRPSGMRNNDVTNFVFKGLRYAQPRINTRHSSRPTGSFQSSFRKLLLIPLGLRPRSNRRNSTQISLRSICYWKWFFHYSDDWNDEAKPRSGMRNVSLTSWTILFCTIPHVREGAQVRVHTWGVILKDKTLVE